MGRVHTHGPRQQTPKSLAVTLSAPFPTTRLGEETFSRGLSLYKWSSALRSSRPAISRHLAVPPEGRTDTAASPEDRVRLDVSALHQTMHQLQSPLVSQPLAKPLLQEVLTSVGIHDIKLHSWCAQGLLPFLHLLKLATLELNAPTLVAGLGCCPMLHAHILDAKLQGFETPDTFTQLGQTARLRMVRVASCDLTTSWSNSMGAGPICP